MSDWSKEWNYCRKCLTTEHKHATEGYCKKCFEIIAKTQQPQKVLRTCLTCGEAFYSKWIGNRRCEECVRREKESNFLDKESHRIGHI
jgi:hypothetical protein